MARLIYLLCLKQNILHHAPPFTDTTSETGFGLLSVVSSRTCPKLKNTVMKYTVYIVRGELGKSLNLEVIRNLLDRTTDRNGFTARGDNRTGPRCVARPKKTVSAKFWVVLNRPTKKSTLRPGLVYEKRSLRRKLLRFSVAEREIAPLFFPSDWNSSRSRDHVCGNIHMLMHHGPRVVVKTITGQAVLHAHSTKA